MSAETILEGYRIKVGVEPNRVSRISYQWLRHPDGAKPIMVFSTRRQALSHIRRNVFSKYIRLIGPDGSVEKITKI